MRGLAGLLAVGALKILARISPGLLVALGTPWLPFYALARRSVRRRLRRLPRRLTPLAYYRMRLLLASLSLRHLKGRTNDLPIRIEGEEHYRAALASGKPVALLGWHQGPVELLHRLPPAPLDGRPFLVVTAGGFSPALTRMMLLGRRQPGKRVVGPGDLPAALRFWIRSRGVLAVMLDQVPARPEDWLSLLDGAVRIPFPGRLWEWINIQDSAILAVSARLEKTGVLFRYQPLEPKADAFRLVMQTSLEEDPDQYNWSYPKIRTLSA